MKLYDVKPGSKIIVKSEIKVPPGALDIKEEVLNFSHIDGMYSYCTNSKGDRVHLVAWAEVEVIDDKDSDN